MKMVTLTVDYGYDIHSINLNKKTLDQIKAGEKIEIDGQGLSHEVDGEVLDHWIFNREPGEISFWLDNGAEFSAQNWWIEDEE
jgi:hypothetical protein